MAHILVEGWRFLPHSYAIVNQFQCLELLTHKKHRLYHRDLPYYNPNWQAVHGLFTPQQEKLLAQIPTPLPNQPPDAMLRIGFPYDLRTGSARTVVFGTAEGRQIEPLSIQGHLSFQQAYQSSEAIIITPSQWSRLGFLEAGADPERVIVVPHGVDPALLRPANAYKKNKLRRSFGWEGFVFLHIGAMTQNKGLDLLLKAFAQIVAKYPEARLVLKGMDALYPSAQFLQQTFQGLTGQEYERVLSRLTYFGGTLPFSQCAQLYQAADAYVSPYRAEGFNLPVLEAAACGLPVICTQGGPTDDFTTADFALYIESTLREELWPGMGKAYRLEPSLDHLISRMEEAIELRIRQEIGPAFIRKNFTWAKVTEQLLQVLGVA
jgi:glycosyltransferase involved in cell wall biosynthesis